MKTNSDKKPSSTPSVDELVNIIHSLQKEMAEQRSELEAQRYELVQLRESAKESTSILSLQVDKTTTRRRMLRKLVAGAAGVAALGATTVVNAPVSQAATNTFDFNGTNGGTGLNNTAATTTIQPAGGTGNYPLFTFINTSTTGSGTGSDPTALPMGLYARSNSSFAIYGYNTGSGTAPSGVIGVVGTNGILSNAFFANSSAGVVGTAATASGTIGVSQSGSGLEGRSLSGYGAKGISQSGVGGAFAYAGSDNVTGAALRLGLRAANPPTGTVGTPTHLAGEFFLDQVARVWVCNAGYQPVSGLGPQAAGTDPGFPTGPLNTTGPNWRILAPIQFKAGAPNTNGNFTGDNELHVRGELWLNYSNGILYTCVTTGSTDDNVLASAGLAAGTRAAFKVAGGPILQLLQPTSDRFVDTRPGVENRGGRSTPLVAGGSAGIGYNFQITGVTGRNGQPGQIIPAGATGVVGNLTLVFATAPTGSCPVKVLPGNATDFTLGTAPIIYTGTSSVQTSFNAVLGPSGNLKFVAFGVGTFDLLVDIVGYYL